MAVRFKHSNVYSMYYCTVTCYQWLHLFEITQGYDLVYKWFDYLKGKNIYVVAYVIMPNHVHCILYFPSENFDLNKLIGNAKRFLAYDIINRLELQSNSQLLKALSDALTETEIAKGQKHRVFEESFDAKPIYSEPFFFQKLDYIHHNPVSGRWKLVDDYTEYEHSSALFYELSKVFHFEPKHYNELS